MNLVDLSSTQFYQPIDPAAVPSNAMRFYIYVRVQKQNTNGGFADRIFVTTLHYTLITDPNFKVKRAFLNTDVEKVYMQEKPGGQPTFIFKMAVASGEPTLVVTPMLSDPSSRVSTLRPYEAIDILKVFNFCRKRVHPRGEDLLCEKTSPSTEVGKQEAVFGSMKKTGSYKSPSKKLENWGKFPRTLPPQPASMMPAAMANPQPQPQPQPHLAEAPPTDKEQLLPPPIADSLPEESSAPASLQDYTFPPQQQQPQQQQRVPDPVAYASQQPFLPPYRPSDASHPFSDPPKRRRPPKPLSPKEEEEPPAVHLHLFMHRNSDGVDVGAGEDLEVDDEIPELPQHRQLSGPRGAQVPPPEELDDVDAPPVPPSPLAAPASNAQRGRASSSLHQSLPRSPQPSPPPPDPPQQQQHSLLGPGGPGGTAASSRTRPHPPHRSPTAAPAAGFWAPPSTPPYGGASHHRTSFPSPGVTPRASPAMEPSPPSQQPRHQPQQQAQGLTYEQGFVQGFVEAQKQLMHMQQKQKQQQQEGERVKADTPPPSPPAMQQRGTSPSLPFTPRAWAEDRALHHRTHRHGKPHRRAAAAAAAATDPEQEFLRSLEDGRAADRRQGLGAEELAKATGHHTGVYPGTTDPSSSSSDPAASYPSPASLARRHTRTAAHTHAHLHNNGGRVDPIYTAAHTSPAPGASHKRSPRRQKHKAGGGGGGERGFWKSFITEWNHQHSRGRLEDVPMER